MTPEQWARAKALFLDARARPPLERSVWLESQCPGDAELQAHVEQLILADEQVSGFLEASPAAAIRDALAGAAPGARIGAYRIRREIGRGGMGAVYLAERDDGSYEKHVAIKLVSGELSIGVRRFREERQILATLEHPNIARLVDGGATAAGLPFLAMEYVEGLPIDVYCDNRRLTITERLKLFRDVCAAVQYAHQRLIVHRDIKPSNVLVTADGVPKLLDFGIAKLIDADIGANPQATATMDRVFTPEYASPEQISGQAITTATDVYQLGVLLYQLLTGRKPYIVTSSLPHHIATVICEQEPQRPSAAVTRGASDTAAGESVPASVDEVATNREGTLERLRRRLQGDLDAIVLKALRKEPVRRYASAEQLSDDIDRHLRGLPIRARADAVGYRARKFVRRHRLALAAVGAIFVSLVAGLAVAIWQTRVARAERNRAEQQETIGRHLLYAAQMNLAGEAWSAANPTRVVQLLDAHVPTQGQTDLRGFEWYYLWDIAHKELLAFQEDAAVTALAISPDGRLLATAGAASPQVHMWDMESGRLVATMSGHTDAVTTIDFSQDGTLLLTASADKTARLWRMPTREPAIVLTGHTAEVSDARFDATGTRLATAASDGRVIVWDRSGRRMATLDSGQNGSTIVAFSRDGTRLATGGSDGSAKLWDATTYRHAATFSDRRPGQITSLAFSRDGRYLVTTGIQWGGIAVWDIQAKSILPMNSTSAVFAADVSPSGRLLATTSHDRRVIVWDLAMGRAVNVIRGHGQPGDAIRFTPDERKLVTGSRDGSIKVWDVEVIQGPAILRPGSGTADAFVSDHPDALTFSPDGRTLAMTTRHGIQLWDVAERRRLRSVDLGAEGLDVAFSPDGGLVAALGLDAAVHVRTVADDRSIVRFPGTNTLVNWVGSGSIAFGAGGALLAAVDGDHSIRVWDVVTWREKFRLQAHTHSVNSIAVSPDGRRLASGGIDGVPRLWDLSRRTESVLLKGGLAHVVAMAFVPDGSRVVAASMTGTVVFWDANTGEQVATIVRGGDNGAAALSPDGRRLIVTGVGDPTITIFDADLREQLLTMRGHSSPINGLAVSPDGAMIATSSNDWTVRLWRAATAADVERWNARVDTQQVISRR